MKKSLLSSTYFFILLCTVLRLAEAQDSYNNKNKQKLSWTTNPFTERVFIENKGQFDGSDGLADSKIQFAFHLTGTEYYFSSTGWTFKHDSIEGESNSAAASSGVPLGRMEEEENGQQKEHAKTISSFLHMTWQGANPDVQIIPGEKVADFYNYVNIDNNPPTTIKAQAYHKITYLNLYEGIDVTYSFPEDKPGIKYRLIVHPGADPSVVKMLYDGASEIFMDGGQNVNIKTSFGDFIDHAPVSYYADGRAVQSSFNLNGDAVSFRIDNFKKNQLLIIDPWTTDPGAGATGFTNYDAGYDVDFDNAGNVYAYGGTSYTISFVTYTFSLIKYNSAGVRQWTTGLNFYAKGCGPTGNKACYGDFAVDASSGSVYMVEGYHEINDECFGFNPADARVGKLNSAGTLIATWDPNSFCENGFCCEIPESEMSEMWRVVYNSCTQQAIIAGGGNSTGQTYQACILDPTLNNITPINVLGASEELHDFTLLTLDNYSNCFMATNQSINYPANFNNVLISCPASSLLPSNYMIPDGHAFVEVSSIPYVENTTSGANGFNGIAANATYLYTYDGSLLKQWDKNSGTFIQSRAMGGTVFASGGIDINDCDTIYIANGNKIYTVEPTNLTTVSTIADFSAYGNVYDLKLGPGNMLYATGRQFVAAIALPNTCGSLNLDTATTPDLCASKGTASANPLGGIGPFTYSWSPGGQTTSAISGIPAGTYTVTVVDLSFSPCSRSNGGSQTATLTVASSGSVTANAVASIPSICSGSATTLNASGGGSYLWSPGGATTSSISVSPVSSGTYTVTVTGGAGCTATATTSVTVNSVTASSSAPATICNGTSTTLTASGGGTYSWSPGGATASSITVNPSSTTTYSVTVTGGGGCTDTASTTVTVNNLPPAPTITKNATGDTLFSTTDPSYVSYQWYKTGVLMGGETHYYLVINPTDTSTFSVIVKAATNCTNTATFSNRALPIELLSFDAVYNGKTVDLLWSTASEINNDYFTVERTKNGFAFTPIVNVKGAGNSTGLLNYHAVDENPLFGVSAYRLKQTDFDGQYAYSRLVAVNIKSDSKLKIIGLNTDPEQSMIRYFVFSTDEHVTLEITDRIGRMVLRETSAEKAGTIDLSSFAHGIYMFRVFDDSGSVIRKFIY